MSLVSKTYSNGSRKSSLYCPFNFSVNLRKGKEFKEKVILSLAWEYSCATVKRKVREIIWDMGKMGMDLCRFSRWTWALGDHQLRRLVSLGNNVLVQVEGEEVSFSSVSHSVVSSSLRPHELQHTRPPCPSQTPGVYSNSCPLSRWCHPSHPMSSPSPPAPNPSQHQGPRIDAFELWCWGRLMRVPWMARISNQSILKEISPGCSLEGLMLKLKLQYFGHLMRRVDSLEKT